MFIAHPVSTKAPKNQIQNWLEKAKEQKGRPESKRASSCQNIKVLAHFQSDNFPPTWVPWMWKNTQFFRQKINSFHFFSLKKHYNYTRSIHFGYDSQKLVVVVQKLWLWFLCLSAFSLSFCGFSWKLLIRPWKLCLWDKKTLPNLYTTKALF